MLEKLTYTEQRDGNLAPVLLDHHVQMFGPCDLRAPHEAHLFATDEFNNEHGHWLSFHSCPGQYAECSNCDDRYCMDCVLRYVHDFCEKSCPMCCR